MNISPCDACDVCREESSTDCIINDDMRELYPKLRQADALVIASPIYWFTVSAQTKLFMDRCYALGGPQGNALAGKQIAIVLTYGDSDPFNSGAVNAIRTFQDAFNYIGSKVVGMVYGSASDPGEIKNNRALMDKAYQTGKQLLATYVEDDSIRDIEAAMAQCLTTIQYLVDKETYNESWYMLLRAGSNRMLR